MTRNGYRSFYVNELKTEIENHLREANQRRPDGFYYYRTHPVAKNLEVMIGPDLAISMSSVPEGVPAEHRARRFLIEFSSIMGLEQETFERQLVLKHSMHSLMGDHCIFELRGRNNKEIIPSYFAVHLDIDHRIVMLHCAYQNSIEPMNLYASNDRNVVSDKNAGSDKNTGSDKPVVSGDQPAEEVTPAAALGSMPSATIVETPIVAGSHDWEQILRRKLIEYFSQEKNIKIQNVSFNYDVWLPDWKMQQYVRGCQAKVQTDKDDYIFLISLTDQGLQSIAYPAVSKLNVNSILMGQVYRGFWEDSQSLKEKQLPTERVVLRDLTDTRGGIRGKYVAVLDNLTDITLNPTERRHLLIDPETIRSGFDQVMVYYHVDLIQRYFRQLGLTLLDSYSELNPLQVTLAGHTGSNVSAGYRHDLKSIVFRQLGSDGQTEREWTMARDARIIYHEYVHSVTDSLARLQRIDKTGQDTQNPRLQEMIQSAAMDEGLADYFACTLAHRQGGPIGEFGTIIVAAETDQIFWSVGDRSLQGVQTDLRSIIDFDAKHLSNLYSTNAPATVDSQDKVTPLEEKYYLWGTHWASYLWRLRDELGADIADMLIANSILYLSRWAGFIVGVCALIQADLLLFGGENQQKIVELSGLANDLQLSLEENTRGIDQPPGITPGIPLDINEERKTGN